MSAAESLVNLSERSGLFASGMILRDELPILYPGSFYGTKNPKISTPVPISYQYPYSNRHSLVLSFPHDSPPDPSLRASPRQSPLALHEVPHLQLSRPVFIYPLFSLHLARSFPQWTPHNPFAFKRFRTLSIATGVQGV